MIRDAGNGLADRCAAGLAGPGSECLGFDDAISTDHDWGPGFCLWLTDEDYKNHGRELSEAYARLPAEFEGFSPRKSLPGEDHRIGVVPASGFFSLYTGLEGPPESLKDWMIPPENLGLCTNGRVFHDPSGFFTERRQFLAEGCPEELWVKRIAVECLNAGQAGQYGITRSARRGELAAAWHDVTRFCESIEKAVFYINHSYPPYYKWLHRGVKQQPVLGAEIGAGVSAVIKKASENIASSVPLIENLCGVLIDEMQRRDFTEIENDFLVDQAVHINSRIADSELRNMHFTRFQ